MDQTKYFEAGQAWRRGALRQRILSWVLAISGCGFMPAAGAATVAALPNSPWAARGAVPQLDASHVAACTACHGAQGRATPSGYFPRLAGKPQEYLFQQLLNFREGRRSYPLMGHLLRHLDDDTLQGMAQYFAALEVPYPAPELDGIPVSRLVRGEQLVRYGDAARKIPACTTCHGMQLTGSLPAVPGLVGLSKHYLNSQLGAWRAGRRSARAPDCMAQVAKALAQEDVSDLTTWLAAQPVPANSHAVAAGSVQWPLACGAAPQANGVKP